MDNRKIDELEAPCSECGAKQKGGWAVYCPFCGKDGTGSDKFEEKE